MRPQIGPRSPLILAYLPEWGQAEKRCHPTQTGGNAIVGTAALYGLLASRLPMQISLTIARICNSFAVLVFHLFRADGAKPSQSRSEG
jgi:hypothetical protein